MDPKFEWPVLKQYDQQHLSQIAMPLGGIGTGTISLGGRGNLCDWEIMNKPRKGFVPPYTFFALRCQKNNEQPVMRILESELQPPFEHSRGFHSPGHNAYALPRFKYGAFYAAYPLGQTVLSTPDMPIRVRIQGFNPMVPGDVASSGIPVAALRFVFSNPTTEPVTTSLMGCFNNFIGDTYYQGAAPAENAWNCNRLKTSTSTGTKAHGLFMEAPGVPKNHSSAGTFAVAVLDEGQHINARPATVPHHREMGRGARAIEKLWRHFKQSNDLEVAEYESSSPTGTVSAGMEVPPGETRTVTVLLGWHFPNRGGFFPEESDNQCGGNTSVHCRNWYATKYDDAWDVVENTATRLAELESKTTEFVRSFITSDVPEEIKEASLFNTSTLRTSTCFRLEDGNFFGFEGSAPGGGCCSGSCTHVWAYETATPYLFGVLSRSMRDVHFLYGTNDEGRMSFRVSLPLENGAQRKGAAADGQMSALVKLYRDWKLNGDTGWLRKLWPKARSAMAFAWIENGWDSDCDGVMEGVQHTTTDLELFGPNPVTAGWYLCALRATQKMAYAVGDTDFAEKCRSLYERGSKWVDDNLFNGKYYIQTPQNPPPSDKVPEGLYLHGDGAGSADLSQASSLPQQIENGCQTDQLVGQLLAHVCGLGYVLSAGNVRETLRNVFRRNFTVFSEHAGFFRAFALNDEKGLIMGSYPEDDVPADPNFRYSELWNGVEYTVAAHMIYEGLPETALEIIRAVRDRYDGRKRNPFNEPECGNHYVRAMASWTCYLAWTGFDYDALTKTIRFSAVSKPQQFFWSNGYAWGVVYLHPTPRGASVTLRVLHDAITLKSVEIAATGVWHTEEETLLQEGDTLQFQVENE